MSLRRFGRKRRAFFELRRGFGQRDRPRRSGQSAARLLHRPDDAVRAQERGADGGGDGAGADGGPASIVAAFCRPGVVVGREGAGEGVRDGAAGDGTRMARSRPGSSTTPAFRRRASILSGWRGNIADSWASRTTARRRSRCRLPIARPACRCAIGFTCRKNGRTTRRADAGLTCLRRSSSRPSRRSPWSRSAGPARRVCRAAWCCSTRAMAITPTCVRRSAPLG